MDKKKADIAYLASEICACGVGLDYMDFVRGGGIDTNFGRIANYLYEIGYRKISDEVVVLTREELAEERRRAVEYEKSVESKPPKVEKFLFVEDGSVDVDNLDNELWERNPEIMIVMYRQGGAKPELVEV